MLAVSGDMPKEARVLPALAICLFDALIYKFKDTASAVLLLQSYKNQGIGCADLQDRFDMIEMIQKRDLDSAESIVRSKLNSEDQEHADKLFRLERKRYSALQGFDHYQGLTGTESEHTLSDSFEVGELLLKSHSDSYFRRKLIRRVQRLLYESHHLNLLLNAALQYQNLLLYGRRKSAAKADLRSFVYLSTFAAILPAKSSKCYISLLQNLAENVSNLSQFGSKFLLSSIRKLLNKCMIKFPAQTIDILQKHPDFSNEILMYCHWSPLGMTTKPALLAFDIIGQYNAHEKSSHEYSSILDVGKQCAQALRLRGDQIFNTDYMDSVEIFNASTFVVENEELWSVCADCTGTYVLYGTEKGKLFVFNALLDTHSEISKLEFRAESQIGTERIKSHPTKAGFFAVMGAGALTVIDATSSLREVFHFDSQPNSYGDVCWHPSDPYTIFYCNDTLEHLFVVNVSTLMTKKKWNFSNSFESVVYCGNSHLALLTAKLQGKRQRILIFDYRTGVTISDTVLPEVPSDGVYSTMVCSQWDHRTIMLISPPNIVLLLDKNGERPTRLIHGPRQNCLMMKAEFFGPMDKYIVVTSERFGGDRPRVLLMNRFTGDLAGQLLGHQKQVNDVTFVNTPGNPMLITCSDDSHLNFYPLTSLS